MNILAASVSILYYVVYVSCSHVDIIDGGVLQAIRTDYHVYENAWSVYLSRKDVYVGEVIIVEICQPQCSQEEASYTVCLTVPVWKLP